MSESRLGITISANDTASASIRQLQGTMRGLQDQIVRTTADAKNAGIELGGAARAMISALEGEVTAIKAEISAKQESANASRTSANAAREQAAAVTVSTTAVARNAETEAAMAVQADAAAAALARGAEAATVNTRAITATTAATMRLVEANSLLAASANRVSAAPGFLRPSTAEGAAGSVPGFIRPPPPPPPRPPSGGGGGNAASSGMGAANREMRHTVALFDEFSRGQTGAMFSTIGAAARDSGLGIGAMGGAVAGLGVAMAGLGIGRHAEELGKWATQLKASASAAGMSVSSYSALQTSLGMFGLKANEADTQLHKLAESLSTAGSQPASKMAEAFRNIGISQQMLKQNGGDVEGGLKMVADAFQQTADGANKTANFNEILGHSFQKLIPLLSEGSTGITRMSGEAAKHGAITKTQADQLEALGKEVRKVGEAINEGAIPAFIAWGPMISSVAGQLVTLIKTVLEAVSAIGQLASAVASLPGIGAAVNTALTAINPVSQALQAYNAVKTVAGHIPAATQGARDAANSRFGTGNPTRPAGTIGSDASNSASYGDTSPSTPRVAQRDVAPLLPVHKGGGGGGKHSQDTTDFIAEEKLKIAEADGDAKKIEQIYDEMLASLGSKYKASAAQIANIEREKVNAVNKARLDEVKESYRHSEQSQRATEVLGNAAAIGNGTMVYPGQRTLGGQAPKGAGTAELSAQAQAIEAEAQKEMDLLRQVIATSSEGTRIRKQAEDDLLQVTIQSKSREIELYYKAAEAAVQSGNKITKAFDSALDGVGSKFSQFGESLISALIASQQTIVKRGLTSTTTTDQGQQIRNAMRSLLIGVASDFAKAMSNTASQVAASWLSEMLKIPIKQGGGLTDLVGGGIKKLLGITDTASKLPEAGKFGLDAAKTGADAVKGAGSAVGAAEGAAKSAQAISAPIVSATTAASAANTAVTTAGAATTATASTTGAATTVLGVQASTAISDGNTDIATTAQTTAITGALAAQAATEDTLLFALNAKPSVLGTTYAGGGIVPSAAGGMVVGSNGSVGGSNGGSLAILHAREMVLPAHISEGVQNMIARGNTTNNNGNTSLNYSPTINNAPKGRGGTGMSRADLSEVMALHGGAMLGEARNMARSGQLR